MTGCIHSTGGEREAAFRTATELLKAGADVNARDNCYRTPLFYACAVGSSRDVLVLLAKHGAHLNTCDGVGYTPMHTAVSFCSEGCVRALLELGASAAPGSDDVAPHAPPGVPGFVGADVQLTMPFPERRTARPCGYTPLHVCVDRAAAPVSVRIANLLIDHGKARWRHVRKKEPVDSDDESEEAAQARAATVGAGRAYVEVLRRAPVDDYGRTCLDIAKIQEYAPMVEMFETRIKNSKFDRYRSLTLRWAPKKDEEQADADAIDRSVAPDSAVFGVTKFDAEMELRARRKKARRLMESNPELDEELAMTILGNHGDDVDKAAAWMKNALG